MGWQPAGALGASVAVGAAWLVLASHLMEGPAGQLSYSLRQSKSPNFVDPFSQSVTSHNGHGLVGTLLDSGEVGQRFPWASGKHRFEVQREA